ncbi:uncharacterized protein DEA37_0003757 [Paragonimus westermani]|uniref:EGF-like domain-containing protein n=1 Tax=Paragonimus westermani TaxID=34504 RepID=A0A5J4NH13_9TREM|nr:uncharacterized protein DEA37_0003757 [Paragonimus westermani]
MSDLCSVWILQTVIYEHFHRGWLNRTFSFCNFCCVPYFIIHIFDRFIPGNEIFADGDVFCDLKQLDYLYVATTEWFSVFYHRLLDSNISCPGGQVSWAEDRVHALRYRLCRHQLDNCDQKVNVTRCPSRSLCEFNGPDCLTCTCHGGYYGHKCMNKKGFPLVSFSTALVTAVLLFSALLWLNRKGERHQRLSD